MFQPCKQWLFSVFLMLAVVLPSFGQDPKTYEGPLHVGDYSGQAVYQYILSDLDTIYNGDFLWQQSNLETLVENEDASFRFSGAFDQGIANGPWQFEFGEYQTNSQSQVVGYEYRVLVSGTQEKGEGRLAEGKPDGNWTYTINQIKDSEIQQILFKSDITYDKGVPQQNFQIENDSSVLVGRFLRDGLAHDEWSYYGTERVEDMEDWFFDDGLLRNIRLTTDQVSNEIQIFDANAPNYKTIPLHMGYIALLEAVLQEQEVESGIASILAQNLRYYQKIDNVLRQLGSDGFQMEAKVKVPFYPLDSLQTKTLEQIASDYQVAANLSRTILRNSHLNIVKRTDPEAYFYYNVAQKISTDFLEPLKALVSYQENDIVAYQEIPVMLQRLWPNGKPGTEITVAANETGALRSFRLPSSEEFGYEGDDLLSVAALGTYARMSLEYIKGSLASRLTNEEQLQMLNGLEEELIQLNNLLEREVDSVDGLANDYKNALAHLQQLADSSLTTYADMKNPNEKLTYGKSIKICLMELTDLAQSLKNIPQQQETIKKEYTNAVWNPFMANVMAEQVKKRITESYEEVLIPYFLKATSSLECGNVKALNQQIIQTHKTILGLRNKDTRKLERKLRREKRPMEVLQLLQVTSTPQNQ
ncbi:MAG: hypothetical protein JJ885_02430 [Muricauda sp.]|jgi:hypothetical protein|nr:hypothetical protein [Allomuricauda sp.]MBO6531908.1 hypothetical protein [Allomuricauda sp.]MBO6589289.1 hypothetical protein [Allomuricauda sp.]MBO6618914.1 hypothetical protein [Allomuricauda sp.]MBO6644826.1 hypothetical protein [Allomuricauda sp.]MBO6746727.1 hypothetical protein [Allomuricauda sp.]